MARKFGLEVDKLAENIQDNYTRHDVDQDPASPLELAQEFVNESVNVASVNANCNHRS